MSLLSVFQRRMKESKLDNSILLDADSTADKSQTELAAIVKAQAALLVKQKEVLQQQRELIQKQESQLKIQDQLIKSQKQKIAELQSSKPAPAKAPAKESKAVAPTPPLPTPKAEKLAETSTSEFLRTLLGK